MGTVTSEGVAIGRAYYCAAWQLRVTERCLLEDFNFPADISFEAAAKRSAMFRAFAKQRSADPIGGEDANWFGPKPRKGDIGYAWLRHGERERAITIFDDEAGIVWLVAYHQGHSTGNGVDPSVAYFQKLLEARNLRPARTDAEVLMKEMDDARAELLLIQGRLMLDRARETGQEVEDTLAGDIKSRVAVEYDPEIEAVTFAFTITDAKRHGREVNLFIAALYPDGEWEMVGAMPSGRQLEPGEIAWQHHHAT